MKGIAVWLAILAGQWGLAAGWAGPDTARPAAISAAAPGAPVRTAGLQDSVASGSAAGFVIVAAVPSD